MSAWIKSGTWELLPISMQVKPQPQREYFSKQEKLTNKVQLTTGQQLQIGWHKSANPESQSFQPQSQLFGIPQKIAQPQPPTTDLISLIPQAILTSQQRL